MRRAIVALAVAGAIAGATATPADASWHRCRTTASLLDQNVGRISANVSCRRARRVVRNWLRYCATDVRCSYGGWRYRVYFTCGFECAKIHSRKGDAAVFFYTAA